MSIQTLTRDNPSCPARPRALTRAYDAVEDALPTSVSGRPVSAATPFSAESRVAAAVPVAVPPPVAPRTEAGRRAAQRRRARVSADRRPPSGVLPSSHRTAAVVTADHGDEVDHREFRIGRWARLVSTLSVLAAAVVLGVVLLSSAGSRGIGQVTVAPGDTLWSIAQQADPGADTRALVDRIRNLNGLDSDTIAVGAVLQVPTASR